MNKIKRIAIGGDLHLRNKEPFKSSAKKVLEFILSNEVINSEETLFIHLGDLLDMDVNDGDLNHILLEFVSKLKNKTKKLLQGNHCGNEYVSALEPLKIIDGVEVIREFKQEDIGGKNFLFLPHIYTDSKGVTMEEKYSNLDIKDEIDYCLFHVMTENAKFHKSSKVCDLSNLNIKKRIGGHYHSYTLENGGDYLGSLQPNSSTEKNHTPKFYIIDLEKGEDYTIDVPLFINYFDVDYPDSLPSEITSVEFPILNIHESIDKNNSIAWYMNEAKEKGINLTINKIFRKKVMNDVEEVNNEKGKTYISNSDYFKTFKKEKSVSNEVSSIVEEVL